MRNLPNYIVQSPPLADPASPPPYGFPDVGIQMFQVVADGRKLQAVCDRFLNSVFKGNNSHYQIEPLMGLSKGIVNIMLLRYPKMICLAPGHEDLGYSSQNELSFMIPVVLKEDGIPINVGFFSPFLYVDNYASLVTGREVIGFPKVRAEFGLSADPSKVDGTAISTLTANRRGASAQSRMHPIFSVQSREEPTDDNDGALIASEAQPLWPYGPVDELYASGQAFSVDPEVLELITQAAGVTMGNYSLKQFRDAQEPKGACYQAIVAAETNIYKFKRGGWLPKSELTLHRYPYLDIAQTLGLPVKGKTVTPINSIWYHASFNFENVTNLVVRAGSSENRGTDPSRCLPLLVDGTRAMLKIYESGTRAWLRALQNIAQDRR